jgi:hypothetical protein
MQSVSPDSQSPTRAVVARSRSCAVLTLLLVVTGPVRSATAAENEPSPAAPHAATARHAAAARFTSVPRASVPPATVPPATGHSAAEVPSAAAHPTEAPAAPVLHSYTGLLTASYLLAPLLAIAVGGGISKLTKRDEISVTGACLMSLLPGSVHVAHGKAGQGLASFAQMAGFTLAGVVGGALIGGLIASSTCPAERGDDCDFAAVPGIVGGALIGGVSGYAGFAIYDVSANASYVEEAPEADAASLQLWVQPMPARAEHASAVGPWSGLQLGLSLEM